MPTRRTWARSHDRFGATGCAQEAVQALFCSVMRCGAVRCGAARCAGDRMTVQGSSPTGPRGPRHCARWRATVPTTLRHSFLSAEPFSFEREALPRLVGHDAIPIGVSGPWRRARLATGAEHASPGGSRIEDPGSRIQDRGSRIVSHGVGQREECAHNCQSVLDMTRYLLSSGSAVPRSTKQNQHCLNRAG